MGHAIRTFAPTEVTGLLPYAGTSGHSGTDTSAERAHREDSSGITGLRQRRALRLLESAGLRGITVVEMRDVTGLHHGQASGVLTVLHKAGRINRLAERRGRCKVYVAPDFVNGRPTEAYKPNGGGYTRLQMANAWDDGYYTSFVDTDERNPYREA